MEWWCSPASECSAQGRRAGASPEARILWSAYNGMQPNLNSTSFRYHLPFLPRVDRDVESLSALCHSRSRYGVRRGHPASRIEKDHTSPKPTSGLQLLQLSPSQVTFTKI